MGPVVALVRAGTTAMAGTLNERESISGVWTARLRDFLNDCVGSAACEETDRIREGVLLLQGASSVNERPDPAVVEMMLGCGATESAVLTILRPEMSFMLSRGGGGGSCLATVVVDDGSEEMISEGATVALALLAAYVSLLLARTEHDEGEAEPDRISIPPSIRLH